MNNPNTPKPGTGLVALAAEAARIESMLIDLAQANGGELDQALEAYLDGIKTQLAEKPDQYKFVMDRLKMTAAMLEEKAEEFSTAAVLLDGTADRMKERIKLAMDLMGTTEIRGKVWEFKLGGAAKRLVVDEELVKEHADDMKAAVLGVLTHAAQYRDKARAADAGGAGAELRALCNSMDRLDALTSGGYMEIVLHPKLNTAKIKEAAESGATPLGAKLEGGTSLRTSVVKGGT